MKVITLTAIMLMCLVNFPGFPLGRAMAADDVPLMTIEELKDSLGRMDVIVIDVRWPTHWSESHLKIEGAIREDPRNYNAWIDMYPKGSTIVFY